MESLQSIVKRQQEIRIAHDDPLVELLFAEIIRMGEDNCVLRDRLDTCYRLAANGESIDEASVRTFAPDPDAMVARIAAHRKYFEDLFSRFS